MLIALLRFSKSVLFECVNVPVHYSESVNQSSLICRYTFTKCCRLQLDDVSIAGATLGFQSSSSSIDVSQIVIASLNLALAF